LIFRLQCFKSAWLYAFLHDGLKFPVNYQRLRSASLVNNNDVQWTLGAILYKTRFLPIRFAESYLGHQNLFFIFLRTIQRVKSTVHYHQSNTDSITMIIVICTMVILCVFIFYRQICRATIRSLLFRRTILHASSSSSNFNQRYQLLTSVIIEDTPSLSNKYSNGKSSYSYNGRLRGI
jgi:hypothetical protein